MGRVLRTKLCRNPRPPGDSRQARIPHHPSPKSSGRGDIGPHPSEKEPLPRQAAQQPFFLEVPALILSSREVSGVQSVRLQLRAPKCWSSPAMFQKPSKCVSASPVVGSIVSRELYCDLLSVMHEERRALRGGLQGEAPKVSTKHQM